MSSTIIFRSCLFTIMASKIFNLEPVTPNMKRTIIFPYKYLNISMDEGRSFTFLQQYYVIAW